MAVYGCHIEGSLARWVHKLVPGVRASVFFRASSVDSPRSRVTAALGFEMLRIQIRILEHKSILWLALFVPQPRAIALVLELNRAHHGIRC